MKTWDCPKKIAARVATIPQRVTGQYWSMSSPWELSQILDAGVIEPSQFHGVEIDYVTYERNLTMCPYVAWHHGDFYDTMRRFKGFNPGFVNADLIQTADTAAQYVSQIMRLISRFDVTLLVNFVMKCRGYSLKSPDYVLSKLSSCQQFRWAMRNGWVFDNRCYLYAGTGPRSKTVMGSFIFRNTATEDQPGTYQSHERYNDLRGDAPQQHGRPAVVHVC